MHACQNMINLNSSLFPQNNILITVKKDQFSISPRGSEVFVLSLH